jgi:hypothetical protein
MNTDADASSSLVRELFERTPRRRLAALAALFVALTGHALAGTMTPIARETLRVPPPPVAVEFLPPEASPPAPPPARVEHDDTPALARVGRAPAPAAAGRLLTARPDAVAEQNREPLDFVSDPSGHGYGSGVVAVGGSAAFGKPGARAGVATGRERLPAGPAQPAGGGLVSAADLGRPPRLSETDPCRGFFPGGADDDSAQASVLLVIGKSGAVASARVVAENPPRQGFGRAARDCMLSKRFVPALDRAGMAVATSLRVNVRFSR